MDIRFEDDEGVVEACLPLGLIGDLVAKEDDLFLSGVPRGVAPCC